MILQEYLDMVLLVDAHINEDFFLKKGAVFK